MVGMRLLLGVGGGRYAMSGSDRTGITLREKRHAGQKALRAVQCQQSITSRNYAPKIKRQYWLALFRWAGGGTAVGLNRLKIPTVPAENWPPAGPSNVAGCR